MVAKQVAVDSQLRYERESAVQGDGGIDAEGHCEPFVTAAVGGDIAMFDQVSLGIENLDGSGMSKIARRHGSAADHGEVQAGRRTTTNMSGDEARDRRRPSLLV